MPPKGFHCKQCGRCCLELEDAICCEVSEEDVRRWEDAGRGDIVAYVGCYENDHGRLVNEVWVHPETLEEVKRCPWLRKRRGRPEYYCRIHDLKPAHCRDYPISRQHARDTGCPGFDP